MEYKYDKDSFMRPEQVLYRRCGEKAAELFPYNTNDQITWTDWCYDVCRDRKVSPQQLKDERTGKSSSTHQQRPIKPFYY
jgi:hypothetical protein